MKDQEFNTTTDCYNKSIEAAMKAGQTPRAWIRETLIAHAHKVLQEPPREMPMIMEPPFGTLCFRLSDNEKLLFKMVEGRLGCNEFRWMTPALLEAAAKVQAPTVAIKEGSGGSQMMLLVTPQEHDSYRAAAVRAGKKTKSAWIRDILNQAAAWQLAQPVHLSAPVAVGPRLVGIHNLPLPEGRHPCGLCEGTGKNCPACFGDGYITLP